MCCLYMLLRPPLANCFDPKKLRTRKQLLLHVLDAELLTLHKPFAATTMFIIFCAQNVAATRCASLIAYTVPHSLAQPTAATS